MLRLKFSICTCIYKCLQPRWFWNTHTCNWPFRDGKIERKQRQKRKSVIQPDNYPKEYSKKDFKILWEEDELGDTFWS